MNALVLTNIKAVAAMAVALVVVQTGSVMGQQPAVYYDRAYYDNAYYDRAYYEQYQQYYRAQQQQQQQQQQRPRRSVFSIFGERDVQQGQQPSGWYPYQAYPTPTPVATPAVRKSESVRKQAEPSAQKTAVATPRPTPKSSTGNSRGQWMTSFDDAFQKACEEGRPLVVLFTHQGCPVCEEMDHNLTLPGAMDSLACAVKVRVEFSESPVVVNRYGIKLTPTFLVLTPDGSEAYREVGALTVERLRMIQPALESLVSGPSAAAEKNVSYKGRKSATKSGDDASSQTVASL